MRLMNNKKKKLNSRKNKLNNKKSCIFKPMSNTTFGHPHLSSHPSYN